MDPAKAIKKLTRALELFREAGQCSDASNQVIDCFSTIKRLEYQMIKNKYNKIWNVLQESREQRCLDAIDVLAPFVDVVNGARSEIEQYEKWAKKYRSMRIYNDAVRCKICKGSRK